MLFEIDRIWRALYCSLGASSIRDTVSVRLPVLRCGVLAFGECSLREVVMSLIGSEGMAHLSASGQLLDVHVYLCIRIRLSWPLNRVESGRRRWQQRWGRRDQVRVRKVVARWTHVIHNLLCSFLKVDVVGLLSLEALSLPLLE